MKQRNAWLWTGAVALLGFVCATTARAAEPTKEGIEFFEKNIRPVLVESCYKCHSVEARTNKKLKAKFYADSLEGLTKGGDSGNPGIVPGKPDESSLIKSIRFTYKDDDESLNMPPVNKKENTGGKLPDAVIRNFETWVKMGAPAPKDFEKPKEPKADAGGANGAGYPAAASADPKGHWAFAQPKLSAVPAVQDASWSKNEVDRFVLARLESAGLKPAAQLDRRALIRRATFDLIGLPPTPEEVEAFVADQSPDAYPKLIDRLLADPRYGEKWARHWLDVARYADTKGYVFQEERRYPYAYTYRDYVIRSFNDDKPYDRFLVEQLAADQLQLGDDKRPLAAMGFLTLGRRFLNNLHDITDDRIDVVTRGTMGLTVACARCHDHKFEPISTKDYYSLHGIFVSSAEPKELPLIGDAKGTPAFEAELAKRQGEVEAYIKRKGEEIIGQVRTAKGLADHLVAALSPERPGRGDDSAAADLSRQMVNRFRQHLSAAAQKKDAVFAAWRLYAALPAGEFEAKSPGVTERIAKQTDASAMHPLVRAAFEGKPPKSMKEVAERYGALLAKFDKADKLANADEESLRLVLRGPDSPLNVPHAEITGLFKRDSRDKLRELQNKVASFQATSPDAPPRAMVMNDGNIQNSAVLVRGNPGNRGVVVPRQFLELFAGPSRKPYTQGSGRLELANAIASKENPLTARVYVNRIWGWTFGEHIVTTPSDFGLRSDPPSHPELLDWLAVTFMNDGWSTKKLHRRLMLSATYQQGTDDNAAARAVDPENRLYWRQNRKRLEFEPMRDAILFASGQLNPSQFGRPVDLNNPAETRRTIYGFLDRQDLPGMARAFDFASPDLHSPGRIHTTVPQQALFFLNSPFVQRQAKLMLERQDVKAQPDVAGRVTRLHQVLFGRTPTPEELALAEAFLSAEDAPANEVTPTRPIWSYGYGKVDPASKKLAGFTPLPFFGKRGWSGGEKLPDAKLGFVYVSANAGHPDGDGKGAIRRWTAPASGVVEITGELAHGNASGDGVVGWVVSSRQGVVGHWLVRNKKVATPVKAIQVEAGDTLDFVVESGATVTSDGFQWAPVLTLSGPKVAGGAMRFDAAAEFSGTKDVKPIEKLPAFAKYVQILMSSNEFMFVD